VRVVEGSDPTKYEIRGCMFESLCYQELFMSDLIDQHLRKRGFRCANIPIGYTVYTLPDAPFPSVPKLCAIFETMGERRLGDHLLVGLERLLPILFPEPEIQSVLDHFPESRKEPTKENPYEVTPTWLLAMLGSEAADQFIDGVALPQFSFTPPTDATLELNHSSLSPELRATFFVGMKELETLWKAGDLNTMAYLFWRLGWEVGCVMRVLRAQQIIWGTYADKLGHHCNAHPNNLVVTLPQTESPDSPLLAPLDFDMAFTERMFSPTFAAEHSNQKPLDPAAKTAELFAELIELERNGMAMALAGDAELNSGATGSAVLRPAHQLLKWTLRDTMLLAFNCALVGDPDPHPLQTDCQRSLRLLIELALHLTCSEIA